MPSKGRMYKAPPQIGGVSETSDEKRLTRQIAESMGARDMEQAQALAAPLFEQGMMQLQQAAQLNPRLREVVRAAMGVLTGADRDEALPMHKPPQMTPTPGGRMRY